MILCPLQDGFNAIPHDRQMSGIRHFYCPWMLA